MKIGDVVTYVDPMGDEHNALVNAVHGNDDDPKPSLNVVFLGGDINKYDNYGRQIEHATSIVHESYQPAHGSFWKN